MVDLVIVLFSIANRLIQLVKDDISHDAFTIRFDVGLYFAAGNDSNLLIVFYVQIMPDDFVMQLHRF